MRRIVQLFVYVLAAFGGVVALAAVAFWMALPAALPGATPPVHYPFGAYPVGGPNPQFPADFAMAPPGKPAGEPFRVLMISSGGEGGAYGAGLLAASTAASEWPDFDVATGVSVGSLMATFAFAGVDRYADLHPLVDELAAAVAEGTERPRVVDIITAVLGRGTGVAHTIETFVRHVVDATLVGKIAAQHALGRRLYTVSTDITSGLPVMWDLGAIASRDADNKVQEIQDALLASISIPFMFPAHLIKDEQRYSLHVDGGIVRPFFVSSQIAKLGDARELEIYFLFNDKLKYLPAEQTVSTRFDLMLERVLSTMLHADVRSLLQKLLLDKLAFGWEVRVASIPQDVPASKIISANVADSIRSSFETAYGTAQAMIEGQGGLRSVWVPLTPQLVGLSDPCAIATNLCAHNDANGSSPSQ